MGRDVSSLLSPCLHTLRRGGRGAYIAAHATLSIARVPILSLLKEVAANVYVLCKGCGRQRFFIVQVACRHNLPVFKVGP